MTSLKKLKAYGKRFVSCFYLGFWCQLPLRRFICFLFLEIGKLTVTCNCVISSWWTYSLPLWFLYLLISNKNFCCWPKTKSKNSTIPTKTSLWSSSHQITSENSSQRNFIKDEKKPLPWNILLPREKKWSKSSFCSRHNSMKIKVMKLYSSFTSFYKWSC